MIDIILDKTLDTYSIYLKERERVGETGVLIIINEKVFKEIESKFKTRELSPGVNKIISRNESDEG